VARREVDPFSGGTIASSVHRRNSRTLRPSPSRSPGHNLQPLPPAAPSVGLGLPSSYSPVTPRNPNRVLSIGSTTRTGRIRSGSIAASQYSSNPFDHVDLGSQTPFADPNFNILLRNSSRMVDESPGEIPEELGGLSGGRLSVPETPAAGGSGIRRQGSQAGMTVTGRARSNSRFSVTTREAVVGEVLAEEQIATADRVKKESEESEQASAPRSFLTSWLYNTLHHDHEDS